MTDTPSLRALRVVCAEAASSRERELERTLVEETAHHRAVAKLAIEAAAQANFVMLMRAQVSPLMLVSKARSFDWACAAQSENDEVFVEPVDMAAVAARPPLCVFCNQPTFGANPPGERFFHAIVGHWGHEPPARETRLPFCAACFAMTPFTGSATLCTGDGRVFVVRGGEQIVAVRPSSPPPSPDTS